MLNVAIVGAGNITQSEHLPNWLRLPHTHVVGIADTRLELARQVGQAYGIDWFGSLGQLLAAQATPVDIVHIASGPATHLDLIRQAVAAGAHVQVEKPLAESATDAVQAVEIARRAGVILGVGYQKEADADLAHVEGLIRTGQMGGLMGLHSVFRISQPPLYRRVASFERTPFLPGADQTEESVPHSRELHLRMLDQTIHHLNVFNRWLGEPIEIVAVARGGPLWSITGRTGRTVVSHINAAASGHGEEFWAYFEHASVHVKVWSPHFPATVGEVEVFPSGGDRVYRPFTAKRNPYLLMLERFVRQVEEHEPWEPSALTAVEDLRLVQRIEQSWADGRPDGTGRATPADQTASPNHPHGARDAAGQGLPTEGGQDR
ncbi:MAG: Gfo/Idh/MocA family oxidoreductase [Bifidobacteriaceae bacterium]|jgi:predicted dehydrogenase|nr:Gfo/Idh/MocA family oxidoreductase [Bifidobacteriaceae bacterium]